MESSTTCPTLYLIPTPLGPGGAPWLSDDDRARIGSLSIFFVEQERTARRFLSSLDLGRPVSSLILHRFDKEGTIADARRLLTQLPPSTSAGVLSEAGAPCVADPGAFLVRAAYELGIRVHPFIGPSSILLALMASGLNGQQFTFHGYAPIETTSCRTWLASIEATSRRTGYTQLWIETPYRTSRMFQLLGETVSSDTLLSLAHDIGGPHELFLTMRAGVAQEVPLNPKAPTVFGLLASREERLKP